MAVRPTLDVTQEQCVATVLKGDNLLVLGGAGTGKSHLLKAVVAAVVRQDLRTGERNRSILVLAPTGVAAANLAPLVATTIHSAFRAELGYDEKTGERTSRQQDEASLFVPKNRPALQKLAAAKLLLIFDEISMVPAGTLDHIDTVLRRVRLRDGMPFGGAQVVAFGDFMQLPPIPPLPITATSLKRKRPSAPEPAYPFFAKSWADAFAVRRVATVAGDGLESDWIEKGGFLPLSQTRCVQLTTSHRQSEDASFYDLLSSIRSGIWTIGLHDSLVKLSSRVPPREVLRIVGTHREADVYNTMRLSDLRDAGTPGVTVRASFSVVRSKRGAKKIDVVRSGIEENASHGHAFLTASGHTPFFASSVITDFRVGPVMTYYMGASVLVIANQDIASGAYNGSLGTVIGFQVSEGTEIKTDEVCMDDPTATVVVHLARTGQTVYVHRHGFRVGDPASDPADPSMVYELRFSQFPLLHGYALVVHRCQSLTIEDPILVDTRTFKTHGALYVALSRGRKLQDVYLTADGLDNGAAMIAVHPCVRAFLEQP